MRELLGVAALTATLYITGSVLVITVIDALIF